MTTISPIEKLNRLRQQIAALEEAGAGNATLDFSLGISRTHHAARQKSNRVEVPLSPFREVLLSFRETAIILREHILVCTCGAQHTSFSVWIEHTAYNKLNLPITREYPAGNILPSNLPIHPQQSIRQIAVCASCLIGDNTMETLV